MTATQQRKQWYILRYIKSNPAGIKRTAEAVVEHFNDTEGAELDIFAPTIVKVVRREGKFVKVEKPLVFQYVFVRGVFPEVKKLCGMENGFSFVLSHVSSERYAVISDVDMYVFRRIALAYRNEIPFYSIEDVDLEQGDKVEIVDGSFPGLVGYYIPKPKSTSGNVVVAVAQNLGTVVYDIKAKYVRVLEFAKNTKRGYDQIDAFIPKLLDALRYYCDEKPLPDKLLNALTIFVRRMESVHLDNPKTEAKLMALVMTAAEILGNEESAILAAERYERRKHHVTSSSTKALLHLLQAILRHNLNHFLTGLSLLFPDGNTPASANDHPSSLDKLLLSEYAHYRSHFLPSLVEA